MQQELVLINPADVAARDTIRTFAKIGGEIILIPYENIKPRPGFNKRGLLGDLNALANLIEVGGLIEALKVDVLKDGTTYLSDGERRWRAIGILRGRSTELKERFSYVKCIANPKGTTEKQRVLMMLQTAAGRKELEPIEQAEAFAQLMEEGTKESGKPYRAADVARETGWTPMYVSNSLRLLGITDEEKEMVKTGEIAATTMVELTKKVPDADKRKEIIDESKESGEKLKVKDVLKREPEYGPGSEYSSAGQEEGKDQIIYTTSTDEEKEEFDKNKPAPALDHDETFDDENNGVADDDEIQQLGSSPTKPKGRNQIDILTEALIMLKSLDAMIDSVPQAADLLAKIDKNIRHAKEIAVAQAQKV